jgi:hypothetical protein
MACINGLALHGPVVLPQMQATAHLSACRSLDAEFERQKVRSHANSRHLNDILRYSWQLFSHTAHICLHICLSLLGKAPEREFSFFHLINVVPQHLINVVPQHLSKNLVYICKICIEWKSIG